MGMTVIVGHQRLYSMYPNPILKELSIFLFHFQVFHSESTCKTIACKLHCILLCFIATVRVSTKVSLIEHHVYIYISTCQTKLYIKSFFFVYTVLRNLCIANALTFMKVLPSCSSNISLYTICIIDLSA